MKYMKMAAIAMMAFALFSCNKKDEPKKPENAVLRVCINEAELLRALDASVADGTKTECMDKVVLTLDNGVTIKLEGADLTKAKSATGYEKDVNFAVNTVALTAHGVIDDNTNITTLQGKILKTEGVQASDYSKIIPLAAPATQVNTTTDNGKTVYSVTLKPVPAVARVEVFGKIEPKENATTHKNAFKSITVEHVYVNNYLSTRNGARHLCVTDGKTGFANDPAVETEMNTAISADQDLKDFLAGTKVAGFQLFPKKDGEAAGTELYDHVILKIKIEYTQDALTARPELASMTERYVTMVKFMTAATGDLESFESGKIYKLNLKDLSDDFKTKDDGTPYPNNPDTPDPEPNAKRLLKVMVEPYTWTAVNIKPDVEGNGYKK